MLRLLGISGVVADVRRQKWLKNFDLWPFSLFFFLSCDHWTAVLRTRTLFLLFRDFVCVCLQIDAYGCEGFWKCNRREIGCFGHFWRTKGVSAHTLHSMMLSARTICREKEVSILGRAVSSVDLSLFRVCGVVCTTQLCTFFDDVSRELKRKKKFFRHHPFPREKRTKSISLRSVKRVVCRFLRVLRTWSQQRFTCAMCVP